MSKKKQFKLPYIGISKNTYNVLYCDNGDYSIVLKCINPILQFDADMDAFYSFHSVYSNIIKTLGQGYTIQKQDILTKKYFEGKPKEGDFLSEKYNEHFRGREYNQLTTNLVITRNVKKSAFIFTQDDKVFDKFIRDIGKVIDILDSKNLRPEVMEEKELNMYIKRCLAFNFGKETFSLNNIKVPSDECLQVDESVIKSMSLVDVDVINLPNSTKPYQEMTDLGFSFPVDLLGFLHEVPHFESIVYNQVITIPNQLSELSKLQTKKSRHDSIPDPANEAAVEDINSLMVDVSKNSQLLVYAHFNIIIKTHRDDIDTATNFIESALFQNGITPSKQACNQLELFRSNLPGNSGELKSYDKFLTTSDAAICFLFKERLITDDESDFQIFFCDRQGVPVAIDTSDLPMETNRIMNRNKFVLGPSGSGKSFFMNDLIMQYFSYGMDIVLIDTGHSYSGLCKYFGGKYITYEEDRPITMNPFRISKAEYNEEKRELIKSLIGLIWKGTDGTLNQIEDTVLSNVVESYFSEYFSNPDPDPHYLSFNSFFEYSNEKIKLITEEEGISFDLTEYWYILKKFYKGGNYDTVLNEEVDNSLFDVPFIVFEIDAIKEHKLLFPITTIIIMDVFIQKMRHKASRKALIIEEAWKAIASPMMASYILYLYKTVRKFWGEAIVVTQELDDIVGNAIVKDSIINNSDTICLLDQTKFKDNFDQVAKLLSINDIERRKIFTVNNLDNKHGRARFKEVYIRRGAKGEVYGVEKSIYEYLTFTTERKEKEAVEMYIREKGNYRDGLESFVADFKASGLKLSAFADRVRNIKEIELVS